MDDSNVFYVSIFYELQIIIILAQRVQQRFGHFHPANVDEELDHCADGHKQVNLSEYSVNGQDDL